MYIFSIDTIVTKIWALEENGKIKKKVSYQKHIRH